MPGVSVWRITAPTNQAASRPDRAVASRRLPGLTCLVKSSMMPAPKAGMLQASSIQPMYRISSARAPCKGARPNASRPAATPRRMPTPPTRGTALWWNFCGPEKSWSSARGCFLATRSNSRLTTTETAKATNASIMWVVPVCCFAADDKGRACGPEPEFRPDEEVKARALQARWGGG